MVAFLSVVSEHIIAMVKLLPTSGIAARERFLARALRPSLCSRKDAALQYGWHREACRCLREWWTTDRWHEILQNKRSTVIYGHTQPNSYKAFTLSLRLRVCFDTNVVKFIISGDTEEEGAYRWAQKNVAEHSVCQHASLKVDPQRATTERNGEPYESVRRPQCVWNSCKTNTLILAECVRIRAPVLTSTAGFTSNTASTRIRVQAARA